jgi:hypothetical protein
MSCAVLRNIPKAFARVIAVRRTDRYFRITFAFLSKMLLEIDYQNSIPIKLASCVADEVSNHDYACRMKTYVFK